jgi:hypothetical protein
LKKAQVAVEEADGHCCGVLEKKRDRVLAACPWWPNVDGASLLGQQQWCTRGGKSRPSAEERISEAAESAMAWVSPMASPIP